MMRSARFFVLVGALLLMGVPGSVDADSSSRPFDGTLRGEVTFPFVGDECPASDVFLGGLRTDSEASGVVTHLGRTTMTSQHCTPAGAAIEGGEMTLVAANGDMVYLEYTGTAPPPGPDGVIVVAVDFDIVGGTGRFDGATGGGQMTAYVVFAGFETPAWPATWVWEGAVIGY